MTWGTALADWVPQEARQCCGSYPATVCALRGKRFFSLGGSRMARARIFLSDRLSSGGSLDLFKSPGMLTTLGGG